MMTGVLNCDYCTSLLNTANVIALIIVIDNPDKAVPTVYLETIFVDK